MGDNSGTIDKSEFRRAISELGFVAPRETLDDIFDDVDLDGGGPIDFKEMWTALRAGAGVQLTEELRTGRSGRIEVKAKNNCTLRRSTKSPSVSSPRATSPSASVGSFAAVSASPPSSGNLCGRAVAAPTGNKTVDAAVRREAA